MMELAATMAVYLMNASVLRVADVQPTPDARHLAPRAQ